MIVASNGFHHLNPKTLLPLDFMFCPKMFLSCRFASTSPFCPQSGFTPSIFKKFYQPNTGQRSTVFNVSSYICMSDCSSRGHKFDPRLP